MPPCAIPRLNCTCVSWKPNPRLQTSLYFPWKTICSERDLMTWSTSHLCAKANWSTHQFAEGNDECTYCCQWPWTPNMENKFAISHARWRFFCKTIQCLLQLPHVPCGYIQIFRLTIVDVFPFRNLPLQKWIWYTCNPTINIVACSQSRKST